MKVLITGAAGFIGSNLAEHLHSLGMDVVGLDSLDTYYPLSLKEHNQELLSKRGIQVHKLDLVTDPLAEVLKGVDVICHLAAQPGISSTVDFSTYERNNVIATQRLLEAAIAHPPKLFINTATSSVYGADATKAETAAPEPISNYGVTKLAAEQLILAAQRRGDLNACSLRLYSVYGARERPDKLMPKLCRALILDEGFPLYAGSERHVRSFTHVADIVKGFAAAITHADAINGQIINIGSDQVATTAEVIAAAEGISGRKLKVKSLPQRVGDQDRTQAVIDKARSLLDYQPDVGIAEGVERTYRWCEQHLELINPQ